MKYFLFLFCLWANLAWAQEAASTRPGVQLTAAYFHNSLINPGLQVGLEWVFKDIHKTKVKERKRVGRYTVTRRRQLALESRLGFFWDPLSQVAVFHQYLFSTRLIYQGADWDHPRWMIAVAAGPGYLRSFLPEAYEVDANEVVTKVTLPSRGYFAPVMAFKFIRERPEKKIKAWFFEVNTQWLFNYNDRVVAFTSPVFGYRFALKKSSQ